MKTIKLNKGNLYLPSTWDELSPKQLVYAFTLLTQLFKRDITPEDFRARMLIFITGYRPTKKNIWYYLQKFWLISWRGSAWYHDYEASVKLHTEMIGENLVRLSREIDFAFNIEGNKIVPNYVFAENPFIFLSKTAPKFSRNYTVETTLTARQYIEACDILSAIKEDVPNDIKQHLMSKAAEKLFGISYKKAKSLHPAILFGIAYWFTGIVQFFKRHPIYSVLFPEKEQEDDNPMSIGGIETLLFLRKEYGGGIDDMNLIDFFNAQVKSIKDSVHRAKAEGVKIDDIVKNTGLPLSVVSRLLL